MTTTPGGNPKVSFKEAIKRGITSFSPLKRPPSQLGEEKDDHKSRYGPPKINLNNEDLNKILVDL